MNRLKSKIRKPVQTRSIETKNRILEAAVTLFSNKGYYKTNTKEIAKKAKVAVGSFYSYFKNKKAVFIEILKNYFNDASSRLFNFPINNFTKLDKNLIYNFIREILEMHSMSPLFHKEIVILSYSDREIEKLVAECEEQIIAYLISIFKMFKDKLKVNDIESSCLVLYKSIDNIFHQIKIHNVKIEHERILRELTEMVYNYLIKNE